MTELAIKIPRTLSQGSGRGIWTLVIMAGYMFAMVGCSGYISSSPKGTLNLKLQIARGINITEINYQVTKDGMDPLVGTFPVTDDINAPVTGVIGGLPAGTGYTITLTASVDDVTCVGSAPFDVVADTTTQVNITVQCRYNRPTTPECGDGIIEAPEECDDGNTVSGDGCSATCTLEPKCGNGIVDLGEECDDGNTVSGDGCSATCTIEPICGNGVLEDGETCDTAIPAGHLGACPVTCTDNDTCTSDTLENAGTCSAVCTHEPIKECKNGDGCCPDGCNILGDTDCPTKCGDGVVTGSETCDKAIPAGQPGACPTTCDDGTACTKDTLTGSADSCNVVCSHQAITQCVNNDGCCPINCSKLNDNDCTIRCGDGIVSTGETCDPPSSCPTSCDDHNSCTTDTMTGSAATCNVSCSHQAITQCVNGDGCCPAGCTTKNDSDCAPVCGNGVVEAGEQCDDGNKVSGDGCSATCTVESVCGTPTTNCFACECRDCAWSMNACFNGPGVATHGPAAGTPKAKLCGDLVQCVQATGCIGAQCLCGTTSFCNCMRGLGNGPCKTQIIAAAETNDPFLISLREFCPYYAVGRAVGVQMCSLWQCFQECRPWP